MSPEAAVPPPMLVEINLIMSRLSVCATGGCVRSRRRTLQIHFALGDRKTEPAKRRHQLGVSIVPIRKGEPVPNRVVSSSGYRSTSSRSLFMLVLSPNFLSLLGRVQRLEIAQQGRKQSVIVGWMCMARWMTVYGVMAYVTSRIE